MRRSGRPRDAGHARRRRPAPVGRPRGGARGRPWPRTRGCARAAAARAAPPDAGPGEQGHPPDCRVRRHRRAPGGRADDAVDEDPELTQRTTTRGAGAFSWMTRAPAGACCAGLEPDVADGPLDARPAARAPPRRRRPWTAGPAAGAAASPPDSRPMPAPMTDTAARAPTPKARRDGSGFGLRGPGARGFADRVRARSARAPRGSAVPPAAVASAISRRAPRGPRGPRRSSRSTRSSEPELRTERTGRRPSFDPRSCPGRKPGAGRRRSPARAPA